MKMIEKFRKAVWIQRATMALLMPALMLMQNVTQANPSGGVVTHGVIGFEGLDTGNLVITQGSDKAIINWQDFSIAKGEITQFVQPGKNSSVLNRVVSGNPSAIFGTLKANGGVMLINTNGILVGAGGVVDIAGNLTLSTLDIDDNDFLNGGDDRFRGSSAAGVTNFGTISSSDGDVIILGNFVENHGSIGALNGQVALGAGGDIIVHDTGDAKISVLAGGVGGGTGITNTGSIEGAAVELKAHGNVYALAINNSGAIRATGSQRINGRVILSAGDPGGDITNTGTIEAMNVDGSGGEILIDGGRTGVVNLESGTVSANGNSTGGTVTVLGGEINVGAAAVISADGEDVGGTVNIGSGDTNSVTVDGTVTANGGSSGGAVNVNAAGDVAINGTLEAIGASGIGGSVTVTGGNVTQGIHSSIDASGFSNGGSISIDSGGVTSIGSSLNVNGGSGIGGAIAVTGVDVIARETANFSATGELHGGSVKVGGDFRGNGDLGLRESNTTTFEVGSKINVDGLNGDAGLAVVWSNGDTIYRGDVSAAARGPEGNGGLIEVSGLNKLTFRGGVDATSVGGSSGMVLFDPGDVSVGNGASDIPIANVNAILQGGTSVLIMTESGNITFEDLLPEGAGTNFSNSDRNTSIQWTHSGASFGALASGSIFINTHIRTSGAGSINLISGWTGFESDFEAGGLFDQDYNPSAGDNPAGPRIFDTSGGLGLFDPEDVWDYYVENGQFGSSGAIFLGSAAMNNNLEVGSRFGNTNVAAANLIITAGTSNGESRFAQLGFRDAGQVFSARADNAGFNLDGQSDVDGNPLAGIAGVNEVDINGDGVVDGVRGINSGGVQATTFIPYANHFNSARVGGWWWQQLDPGGGKNGVDGNFDPAGLGGLRPEHGAGQDEFNRADINVITTGSVNLIGGGRANGAAQIGHGGDATGWADNRTVDNTGTETNNTSGIAGIADVTESIIRMWSFNGSSNDRVATSIARLAPVYGNINVLAGVNTTEAIIYNPNAATKNLTATVDSTAGVVSLRGYQPLGASNDSSNPENHAGQIAPVLIGHGGAGQSGRFIGDIYVEAGGDVSVIAGSQSRDAAMIGHTTIGYAYWNPTDNENQQIRFFANRGDLRDPNLRRGELFNASGQPTHSIMDPALDTLASGANRGDGQDRELEFSPAGPVMVEALDGHVVKGFHGNITVISKGGNGVTVRGYETADTRDPGQIGTATVANGLRSARTDRFAGIGHGGRGFAFWAEESGYSSNRTNFDREIVAWYINGTDETTGTSASSVGIHSGPGINRALTFMNITGDVDVQATQGNVTVVAGNNESDWARIGHGGRELADYETSGIIAGDINVEAAGHITVIAGGLVDYTGDAERHMRSEAQIGHGGYRTGFFYLGGDVSVVAGAAGTAPSFTAASLFAESALTSTLTADGIMLIGGAYRDSNAKIGHGGAGAWGQVGGDFNRVENFTFDNVSTDIEISYVGGVFDAKYTGTTSGLNTANGDHTHGDPTIAGITNQLTISGFGSNNTNGTSNTANITVDSGASITMAHLEVGDEETDNMALFNADGRISNLQDAFVQIGHGGADVDAFSTTGNTANYDDKVGDIKVTAVGDLLMENGVYDGKWTRIGHGGGDVERPTSTNDAMVLSGNIDITVDGNLTMDGRAGGETDPNQQHIGLSGFANPVERNAIQIGHGAIFDAYDVVVVEDTVNGIDSTADITIDVGNDMKMYAGDGYRASFTQVGHGFPSDVGNDRSRFNNVATGFTGDITVNVGNDLYMEASPNAYSLTPIIAVEEFVTGASAVIGHGGTLLDAPATGNISVFTGNDLTMVGSQRTEAREDDSSGNAIGSILNTVKIGHYSNETDRLAGHSPVTESNMEGDIVVVVTNDLTMTGSSTPDGVNQPLIGAINQIGHSGPGVDGDKIGNITILVGNDLVATGGASDVGAIEANNTTQIGHGDWLRDGFATGAFQGPGAGLRQGDINIAVGKNATFGDTADGDTTDATARPVLVGHADVAVQNSLLAIISGDTRVAVSRNFPFFGGEGTLTTVDGSVFSSALYGLGGAVEFYIPQRSNNLMGTTTRINEVTAGYAGTEADFADSVGTTGAIFDASQGILAGREDEVYLTPDLWWSDGSTPVIIGGTNPFPTSLAEVQGGSISEVSDPGGIPNLVANNAGVLGDSNPLYRAGNGVSGAGQYTIYYDAIIPVSTTPAAAAVAPPVILPPVIEPEVIEPEVIAPIIIPVDFLQFLFSDKFDSFDRDDEGLDGLTGEGGWLFAALGLFEGEENSEESGVLDAERALDNIFGARKDKDSSEEKDEEARRKKERTSRPIGSTGLVFYVFDPQGNKYSSHRVFGAGGF